ncbi:MAG TPA: hypothetical protein VJ901_17360 [Thermoanaerobaculia bacterium]|nr:hypothetical protein [Thermoanaerobaculia bacterium]
MRKIPAIALIAVAFFIGCTKEKSGPDESTFAFVVYPGAKYLSQVSDLFKQAHKVLKPSEEPPATAVYDTDAPIDDVANYYAQSYGYGKVAADSTNNLSAAKPAAYFRTGDLAGDTKATEEIMKKVGINPDVTKATGSYRAAEIEAKPNRPRVTIQRPYFDPTKSQVVDRTLILMFRQ